MVKTRLIRLLAGSKKYIFYQVLWQWIALLAQVVMIFRLTGLVESMLAGTLTDGAILQAVGIVTAMIVVRILCDRLTVKASYQASLDVKRVLREQIYQKLLRLGSAYREQVSTAEVVQMSVEGVEQLETYFGRYLSQLFYSLLAPLTLFAVLFPICRQACVALLIAVPLIPMSIVLVQKIAKRLLSRYWDAYANLGDSFLENLEGLTTLKIYRADGQKAEEMDREAEHFRKITMKVLTMQLNSTSVMDIMAYGGAAVGMIVVLRQYFAGNVTLGGTLAVCLLAAEFFIPLRILGSFFHIAMNGMAASDRIFALLDLPEPEPGTEILDPSSPDGIGIDFEHVDFQYTEDREILKDISFSLPPGSFTSIVGVSGSGKSTIAGLLMAKNKGYRGSIRVSGKELSGIREESLMSAITMVTSRDVVFKGTILDNLLLGRPDASEADCLDALGKVQLLDFVQAEGGLEMPVLENGSNLSGGQRQRLVLARALLHNTPVYLFDEATSNIDMESEEMIMAAIRELAKTRTVILISHRLANTVASDCIYVLSDGGTLEQGTHEELMALEGRYYTLYRTQQELEQYGKGCA